MDKSKKVNKRRRSRKRKNNNIRNTIGIIIVLIVILIGVGALSNNKNKDDIAQLEGTSVNGENIVSSNDSNEDKNDNSQNDSNDETVNTATNKQNLVYTNYENDINADNAKDVEGMLSKWNYLREDGKKIAYLTFDDGPSTEVTPKILETLKSNNVKATFFVLGSNVEKSDEQKELLKEMVVEGHAIGNHGYCHDYSILYPGRVADPTAFMNDMNKSEEVLKSVLGNDFSTKVIRFPGGHMSWKTSALDSVLEENGYSYIDWNTLNGDAEGNNRTTEQLINRLQSSVSDLSGNNDALVVLMHDTNAKETTAQSLQQTIDYLKSLGYEFRTLK